MDNKTLMNFYKIIKYINLSGIFCSISNIYLGINPALGISTLVINSFGTYYSWDLENDNKKKIKNEELLKKVDRVYNYIQECKSENKPFHKSDLEAVLK